MSASPYVNFLVSEIRSKDLKDTNMLIYILEILGVGLKAVGVEQVHELAHSLLHQDLRKKITGAVFLREIGAGVAEDVMLTATMLNYPPNTPPEFWSLEQIQTISDIGLTTLPEAKTVKGLFKQIRTGTNLRQESKDFKKHTGLIIAAAWLWVRLYPNTPFNLRTLKRLVRYCRVDLESKTVQQGSPLRPVYMQLLSPLISEDEMVEAFQTFLPLILKSSGNV